MPFPFHFFTLISFHFLLFPSISLPFLHLSFPFLFFILLIYTFFCFTFFTFFSIFPFSFFFLLLFSFLTSPLCFTFLSLPSFRFLTLDYLSLLYFLLPLFLFWTWHPISSRTMTETLQKSVLVGTGVVKIFKGTLTKISPKQEGVFYFDSENVAADTFPIRSERRLNIWNLCLPIMRTVRTNVDGTYA